jgi:hypothetical protein
MGKANLPVEFITCFYEKATQWTPEKISKLTNGAWEGKYHSMKLFISKNGLATAVWVDCVTVMEMLNLIAI